MLIKKIKNYLKIFDVVDNQELKKIIGLDINDYYISFVLLTGNNVNDVYIENYGFQIIPKNLVKNRVILDLDKIVVILQDFLKKIKLVTKDCILILPYNSVTTKFFTKISNSKEDIYELAHQEVQKISSLDDVHFDVCGMQSEDSIDPERFLLALSKKEYVDERIYLAEELKLNLLCLDAFNVNVYNNNIFYLNKIHPQYKDITFCILSLDTSHSSIKFFHHNYRLSSGSIELNMDNFIKDLQLEFNLTYEDSVNFILNKSKYNDTKYSNHVDSLLKNISNQVFKAINIFELTRLDDKDPVSLILVNVFGDVFNDLPKLISERTGIKSIIPLSIKYVKSAKKINESYLKNILNICFGISLRGFL